MPITKISEDEYKLIEKFIKDIIGWEFFVLVVMCLLSSISVFALVGVLVMAIVVYHDSTKYRKLLARLREMISRW